ncbi:glycosyltransferase [Limnoraphis robusta Tam1]|uniref:Glycosyltransferase n=1 Tax=Limnoraphis robusta CCNP1315 TaxID=3110306 RepID=A0ABU5TSI2_9CYAN|nr:glycosyltransferase [Limnoraphis robusta]MEA5496801.1 glycosyltransferase [Limnoraphis robusta BA-68 BA1]MEA5517611.1 glycosyltransferase [Limnoraphis robusta CCNP1315]MEA5541351.1 glycosyltransferase [Limnoraphis robusta Tam1]MEA5544587.1 glycosyltransferase [Limnoraphis robusta CCNP1324]
MINVSVVVPIYNGEADLPDLIECLRSQTYPQDRLEYLLVDNNSRDRTAEILQTLATDPIRPLSENRIQSSYAARNQGIRIAQAEIVAFTDADCRPQPQWLEKLVKPFEDAAIGIVVGEIVALPGQTLLEKHADRQDTLSQKHTITHKFFPYGQTANLAIRRQIFAQVGLFRPYLTTGGDADICWRIQQQTDYKVYFAEDAIIKHRHRATLRQLRSQWRRYGESNRYLHELYGVELMRDFTTQDYLYRLGRWLLKEMPINSIKAIAQQADLVDILNTPIGLLNVQARCQGQKQAKLPEKAKEIEQL